MYKNYQLRDECLDRLKVEFKITDQDKYLLSEMLNQVERLDQIVDYLSPNNVTRGGDIFRRFLPYADNSFIKGYAAFLVYKLIEEVKTIQKEPTLGGGL